MSSAESILTVACWSVESTEDPFWLVRDGVDEFVDAELVRLVVLVDGAESRIGPLPELGDVRVVVRHRDHPLLRVVVLEERAEDRPAAVVVLRDDVDGVDLDG